jgi:tRNA-dihydrouridine synthase 1
MLNAKLFVENLKYRNEMLTTIKEEITNQTLIIQFCANNPDYFLKAAELVQDQCIAVDLNLGCPQHIAKRGNYGSFLQDKWDLVEKMVSTLAKNLKIPITCKIRVFESIEKTVEYAKMIEKAGASLLTVHGRLRSQKGTVTGLADWSKIAAVKKALSIPVVANGNILYRQDIDKCLQATGADGVMSAEGHLYNPAIFTDEYYASWYMAEEYLKIVQLYPHSATPSQGKAHFFKLFHSLLSIYTDLRDFLGSKITTWNDLIHFVSQVKERVIVRIPLFVNLAFLERLWVA